MSSTRNVGRSLVVGRCRRAARQSVCRAVALLLLAAGAALSACGGGRATPTDALQSLRAAMTAEDGARVFELHDADCRAFHLQRIRTVRARLEGGEPAQDVLLFADQTAATFLEGTPEDAAARLIVTHSEFASDWEWLREATVVAEEIEAHDGEQRRARVRLRAADGAESDIFFVEEPSGWAYDQFRLHQESRAQR